MPAERGVRSGYLPESTKGADRLGIEDEFRAFARLIADLKTKPPLSIGLLGDWGSGKSFFMEKIQEEVESVTGTPGFCTNVAQINFNAWHVSDANLWASVVDHLFTEIWKRSVLDKGKPEETRRWIREEIKKARGAMFEAERQLEVTRADLAAAEQRHDELVRRLAIEKVIKEQLQRKLRKAAAALGWQEPLEAVVDLERSATELRDSSRRINWILHGALTGPALRRALLLLLLTVGLAGFLAWLGAQTPRQDLRELIQFVAALGGVVGSIASVVAGPLSKANSLVGDFVNHLDEAVQEYGRKTDGDTVVATARVEFAAVEERLSTARRRLAVLEEQQISMDPSRRLISFLEERTGTAEYRSKQGIISLVRRDFEELAARMADWIHNRGNPPDNIRPIDRIVLYIDDLDRCSHEIVVQTLEAIHMLLAFDLFVVVVAVDSRWLLRSLDVHYHTLLTEVDGDSKYRVSTPQNYLEKIFQITYALAPMTLGGFGEYVEYLTSSAATEPAGETPALEGGEPDVVGEVGEDMEAEGDEKEAEHQTEDGGEPKTDDDGVVLVAGEEGDEDEDEQEPVVSSTRALRLQVTEEDFLKKLYPLVTTPRLAKRIVNVYRLIKVRWPYDELEDLEAEGGRHRGILLLLGILFGRPTVAEEIFRRLAERDMRGSGEDGALHEALAKLVGRGDIEEGPGGNGKPEVAPAQPREDLKEGGASAPDGKKAAERSDEDSHATSKDERTEELTRLAATVEEIAPDVRLEDCELEARELARYSLVTGQVWHTWESGAPPKPHPPSDC